MNHQLELFAIRCCEVADKTISGRLPLIEAVDMLYTAAVWSDLVESAGDDAIQQIMASAFATARRNAE